MPFIETKDGTHLFYNDWGTGKPVVFLSTVFMNSEMWEYQIPYMANKDLRCIAYDRRGHGRSDWPWNGYDYDTLADDLAELIENLNLHEVTLIGHSIGGDEIIRYLTRHGSDRIVRIALLAANGPFRLKTTDNPEGMDKSVFEEMAASLAKDRPKWVSDFAPTFFGVGLPDVSVSPELMQWMAQMALQCSTKATMDCFYSTFTTDLRAEMRMITVPTLIIQGDTDKNTPIEVCGRKSAQLVPGNQFIVYEGAAHGLFVTHADRLNADLLQFIKG